MIALNAPTLNAPDSSSLINLLQGSADSTISSSSSAQDFTAILTEMVGSDPILPAGTEPALPGLTVQATLPALTAPGTLPALTAPGTLPAPTAPGTLSVLGETNPNNSAFVPQNAGQAPNALDADQVQLPLQSISSDQAVQALPAIDAGKLQQLGQPAPSSSNSKKTPGAQKDQDASQCNQVVTVPFVAAAVAASVMNAQNAIDAKPETRQPQKPVDAAETSTQPVTPLPATTVPAVPVEIQQAWADLKKFEFNVQTVNPRPGVTPVTLVQQQGAQIDPQKEVTVTTDPIANLQLQQLPPRITAIEKVVPEAKLSDRTKSGTEHDSADASTTTPVLHFGDVTKQVEQIDQARPAQPVEIPQTPHVQVVRTVAMEVGDADSQVTVRIQERSGDISLQINTPNEPLHQDLQSSVGSLVHALKQEQVQVSNVEVSRKSPIDKVRRMKEAH